MNDCHDGSSVVIIILLRDFVHSPTLKKLKFSLIKSHDCAVIIIILKYDNDFILIRNKNLEFMAFKVPGSRVRLLEILW